MTPCAKLSRSVSGTLPNPRETLAITFVVLLEGFWLNRMVELLSKANSAEVFAQEIAKKNCEKGIVQTYKCSSLVYLRILLTCMSATSYYSERFVS